ncbi:MAG TPA: ABC transporter substrate-binding protein [Jiangellaceae bacterium]|nr:ABC transporter substrate-binding protein [Jiangellaceae bacterium]
MRAGRRAGLTVLATAAAMTLAACGGLDDEGDAAEDEEEGATATVRIGYVSPRTGALAPFGEADTYVIDTMTAYFEDNPLTIGDQQYAVEVIAKDAASDSDRAGEVAAELINDDEVDLILASSTPDIVNPVADQCEANAVPCITTVAPWQPYYFGRGATPDTPFTWTYHFFWGLEDVEAVYLDMWNQVDTNMQAGALWPNDPDGTAWGDPQNGFAPVVAEQGYSIVDPGFYPNGTQDFTAQISAFKDGDAQVLLGVPIPPDFTTFWNQAKQQDYNPTIATIGKALLFPSSIEALGDIGNNLGTEVWWTPSHPYESSVTGQSSQELAEAYESETGKQWTQPLGFAHALFEVAAAALEQAGGTEAQSLADVLAELQVSTIVGDLDWTSGPVPNVAKTPLVGGQWRVSTGGDHPFDLVVVSNSEAPDIPTGGEVEALQ